MIGKRFRTFFATDLRFHFTRPLFWVLVVVLFLMAWGLSAGNVSISTGDSTIGGTARAWITSEFAVGMMLPIVTFLLYSFFVAVAAGMLVPRDDELGVSPVLHATPLKPREYVWSRFLAVLTLFLVVLGFHLLFSILFNQVIPNDQAELIRGPFVLQNYLRPALVFAVPFLIFLTGASFAVGEFTRRPILVFVMPVALFLASIFFLWGWSPSWLDPRWNRLLMWLEPSGYRWINETWLKVDLGVEVYNTQPIGYDLPFLASRLAYALLGVGLVTLSSRHFAATLRGPKGDRQPSRLSMWLRRMWLRRRRDTKKAPEDLVGAGALLGEKSLADLGMRTKRPGFLTTLVEVARFEARNLRGQPGLYIFLPLILLQTIGSSSFRTGAFDTPILLTPGTAAVGAMNTLTLLVAFLLLFYTVESIHRESATGLDAIAYATPARTTAFLSGKALANAIVGVVVLVATYLGSAAVMLYQGEVTPSIGPFLFVWGLLLVPTFLAWSAFVTALFALTRSRFATYGLGLGAMTWTGWVQSQGEMNWVGNWTLWSTATWSDFGALDPNSRALLLNRLFWIAVAVFLIALTVKIFPRRQFDAAQVVERLTPRRLLGVGWRLLPAALPAIVLGIVLGVQVSQGFQGGAAERREEEYRGRNLITWWEADTPSITGADVDLVLEPDARRMTVSGTFELRNDEDRPLRRFPMSVGEHFENLEWTLGGEAFEPENEARMHVFDLPEPLAPGETVDVGFSFTGAFPRGLTKNGGGMGAFVLPSGVVLRSFSSEFLPVPYFETGRGVDEDNRLEPRDYEDGYWEGQTDPAFGGGSRYPVRVTITGPERFRYNSVGVKEEETISDGLRTVVWKTDHPVSFWNVVAAEWEVWEGEGVEIYYHPEHNYNLEEIGEAFEASRKYYSEWFYPYPWTELKLSEFPGIATYAQGFPTNITFSESIGFLTRSTREARVAFLVTAHETAHQWWGNILVPGDGPGGNILSEGMAHFSTLLLYEAVHGVDDRIELARRLEERYGDNRQVDSERPLVWIDGSKAGDTTVTYDKGGWVFWMLLNHMGRDTGLAGYRDFIHRYAVSDDYPLLQDFLAVMREHAADPDAFDAFAEQWFYDVVVPEIVLEDVTKETAGDGFLVRATVKNKGTGRMPFEIAVMRGERFPDEDAEDDAENDPTDTAEPYHEARTTVVLGADESATIEIPCDFDPEELVVDPDALVLMLGRERAVAEIEG